MIKPSNIDATLKTLPEPDAEAVQRSQLLVDRIKQACKQQGGAIGFSEYMRMALYEPGLGYYAGGLQKFGASGDFITAPEVSALFSQCIARQCAQVFENLQLQDEPVNILEFGAGSGVMAADILLELEVLQMLPDHYYIVELSAELKQRQQQTINKKAPHLIERVVWLEILPEQAFQGVVLANEVLDAMPVECFRISASGVELLNIVTAKNKLTTQYVEAGDSVVQNVRTIEERRELALPEAYCSEFNPVLGAWLKSLSQVLSKGVVLLVDYGYPAQEYYHGDRSMGTLICHYQHRAHTDALWYPGLQDITAFVDFSAVAYAALEANLGVCGYTTQAEFLVASGLEELHQAVVTDEPRQQLMLAQQIKTLTLPSEMGERFKVMALCKDYDEPLMGFSMRDYRSRL